MLHISKAQSSVHIQRTAQAESRLPNKTYPHVKRKGLTRPGQAAPSRPLPPPPPCRNQKPDVKLPYNLSYAFLDGVCEEVVPQGNILSPSARAPEAK